VKGGTKLVTAIFVIAVICGLSVTDGAEQIRLKFSAPKADSFDVPVHVVIEELPEGLANLPVEAISVELRDTGTGQTVPGQLVGTSRGKTGLWWILPRAKANRASTWVATIKYGRKTSEEVFSWKGKNGEYLDLLFNGRKITCYMYACDTSNPQRIFETYKPFPIDVEKRESVDGFNTDVIMFSQGI